MSDNHNTIIGNCLSPIYTSQPIHFYASRFDKEFLENISPFCGTTDTPVLDFW